MEEINAERNYGQGSDFPNVVILEASPHLWCPLKKEEKQIMQFNDCEVTKRFTRLARFEGGGGGGYHFLIDRSIDRSIDSNMKNPVYQISFDVGEFRSLTIITNALDMS